MLLLGSTAGDVANYALAAFLVAVGAGLGYAFFRLGGTFGRLSSFIRGTENELLPVIPLWERYGNNPALEGERVTGWLPDSNPIYQNSPYEDSFTVMMIMDGTLKPAGQ